MSMHKSILGRSWLRWLPLIAIGAIALVARAQSTVKDGVLKFELPDLQGRKVTHADERFKGKVVLVDIWGTWCPPCIEEVPFLVKMDEKYRDKGLEIVGAAFEKEGDNAAKTAALKKFAADKGIKYTLLLGGSPAAVRKAFPDLQSFQGFPTNIFIDRKGRVRKIEIGFSSDSEKTAEAMILRLLEEKAEE